jgi:hypothetical protein
MFVYRFVRDIGGRMKKEKNEIQKIESPLILSDLKSFSKNLKLEKDTRKLILKFIEDQLKDGIDYGEIHINKDCTNKYNCDNPRHYSKPCLFKSGSEKFISLLKLRAEFIKDDETLSMIPEEVKTTAKGILAYKCNLIHVPTGNIIAEGRGACTVKEKGNINNAVKIGLKRSQVDAVLRLGLSEVFTQDLEDGPAPEIALQKSEAKENKEVQKYIKLIEALGLPENVIQEEIKEKNVNKNFRIWTNLNNLKGFYKHLQKLIEIDKKNGSGKTAQKEDKTKKEQTHREDPKDTARKRLHAIQNELKGLKPDIYEDNYFKNMKIDMFEVDTSKDMTLEQMKSYIEIINMKLNAERKAKK